MARVNVEQKALTDTRYEVLGLLIKADRHAALGRMVRVWNECQERGSCTLSRVVLDLTNPDIPEFGLHVVAAELGRETSHGIYIAGAKGRVEWLSKAQKNGKLGGRPKGNQTVTLGKPHGSPENNPLTPSLTPSLAPTEEESKTSRPTSKAGRTRQPFADDSRELKAAKYLFRKIAATNPSAKEPNFQTWAREFDRIFRIDKRDPKDLAAVIDWCQRDAFWSSVILSPANLRKQYDRLKVVMSSGPRASIPGPRMIVSAPEKPE